jgi:hypothetical protein
MDFSKNPRTSHFLRLLRQLVEQELRACQATNEAKPSHLCKAKNRFGEAQMRMLAPIGRTPWPNEAKPHAA